MYTICTLVHVICGLPPSQYYSIKISSAASTSLFYAWACSYSCHVIQSDNSRVRNGKLLVLDPSTCCQHVRNTWSLNIFGGHVKESLGFEYMQRFYLTIERKLILSRIGVGCFVNIFRWIAIYLVESAIQPSNKWGLRVSLKNQHNQS